MSNCLPSRGVGDFRGNGDGDLKELGLLRLNKSISGSVSGDLDFLKSTSKEAADPRLWLRVCLVPKVGLGVCVGENRLKKLGDVLDGGR